MRKLITLLVAGMTLAPLALTGCEKTVSEQVKSSTDSNGNTKVETKKVTQDSQGNTTVTEEKHTSDTH